MTRYKGTYVGTIKAEHVGKSFFRVFGNAFLLIGFGRIMLCDVGKKIYNDNKVMCIENTEQLGKRLAGLG